jgi:hypothetical protein
MSATEHVSSVAPASNRPTGLEIPPVCLASDASHCFFPHRRRGGQYTAHRPTPTGKTWRGTVWCGLFHRPGPRALLSRRDVGALFPQAGPVDSVFLPWRPVGAREGSHFPLAFGPAGFAGSCWQGGA